MSGSTTEMKVKQIDFGSLCLQKLYATIIIITLRSSKAL